MTEQESRTTLSGDFESAVASNGGESVDMRDSQGAVYKPGVVKQHFGTKIINVYVEQDSKHLATAKLQLPPRAYHHLIGRYEELDTITKALRAPDFKPIVVVVGLGGIGKTALAREAVEQCWKDKCFEHIVWTSAKTECFVGGVAVKRVGIAEYNFDTLLSDIGRQCDRLDIPQMSPEQKRTAVKYLLAKHRVLVVMDNLETIPENEKLVHDVYQILGQSKLFITSRHHVKHDKAFIINLGGFPEREGLKFLREESQERNIEAVAKAGREHLLAIHEYTGGAPLAMKLVIGQIARQPLDVVLDTLCKAEVQGQDYPFYRFVYYHSWQSLDMPAKMALVDMSVFPPLTGGAVMDVQAISQVPEPKFWPAMDQLVTMSLVDKIGVIGKERFALHPLTQYFIKSDVTREWSNSDDNKE
jgi:hypothetical protein